ncbi:MAG: CsgG/HfaB family protein [Candidatus Firestonebacteria bacterium]
MKKYIFALTAVMLLASACAVKYTMKKDYDFSKIKRIAVINFSDNSGFRNSGEVVADEFVMQMIGKGYNVIERNKIEVLLRERQIADLSDYKQIGRLLGVDAIITGSVIKYHENMEQTVYFTDSTGKMTSQIIMTQAEVEISARMIDAATGEIVWTARNGDVAFELSDAVGYCVSGVIDVLKNLKLK